MKKKIFFHRILNTVLSNDPEIINVLHNEHEIDMTFSVLNCKSLFHFYIKKIYIKMKNYNTYQQNIENKK